jgi:anti-sigma B factor antagonist
MTLPDLELEQTSSAGDDAAVKVTGDVDMATAPLLRTMLEQLIDVGSRRIVLDCHGLTFLDSSGIGVLVAARNRMGGEGEIVLESPPAHVRRVLDITGVSEHLSIVP